MERRRADRPQDDVGRPAHEDGLAARASALQLNTGPGVLTDDLIRSPGQVPRGFGAGRVTCSATARSPRGPGPAALGLRALQLLQRGSNMTSDDDMLWRRCAYLGRVLPPLLDQECGVRIAPRAAAVLGHLHGGGGTTHRGLRGLGCPRCRGGRFLVRSRVRDSARRNPPAVRLQGRSPQPAQRQTTGLRQTKGR